MTWFLGGGRVSLSKLESTETALEMRTIIIHLSLESRFDDAEAG